jgi:hypothetical protein
MAAVAAGEEMAGPADAAPAEALADEAPATGEKVKKTRRRGLALVPFPAQP